MRLVISALLLASLAYPQTFRKVQRRATGGGGPTITISASACAGSADGGITATTSAINTTGVGALLVAVSFYQPGTVTSVTDSKSNTWVPATLYSNAPETAVRFYLAAPDASHRGSGHTFTVNAGGNIYPSVCVAAVAGATQYGAGENGPSTTATTVASSSSLTPAGANYFVCSAISLWTPAVTGLAPDSPFTIVGSVPYTGATNLGIGMACYQQSGGPSAVTATWRWTNSTDATVNIVSIKP